MMPIAVPAKSPNTKTGPATVKSFPPTPRTKPSFLNSIAGATIEFANPVMGTITPAPANFAMVSNIPNPVRSCARIGSGQKKKPLADKIAQGNPGKRKLEIIDFQNTADLKGQEMPKPRAMLSAVQKDGKTLVASEIYEITWKWLEERGCAHLVLPQLLERYAMSAARWIQCEEAVTEFGFLAKHPTTGNAIQSPYVAMSQNFMSQTNRLWMEIYQIVKENCATEYSGLNPQDDVMERLLSARRGK
jgi:hypothetical protein